MMTHHISLSALVFTALLANAAHSATIRVPQDYPMIQQAITASSTGDVIVVKKGTYTPFSLSSRLNVTVKGLGKVVINAVGNTYGIQMAGAINCKVENLRVKNSSQEGAYLYYSTGAVLKNCQIDAAPRYGIHVVNSFGARLVNNKVTDAGSDGIRIESDGVLVDGNKIIRANSTGIRVIGDLNTLEANRIQGGISAAGIWVDGGSMNAMLSNRIVRGSIGMRIVSGSGHQVVGNRITRPVGYGLIVDAQSTSVRNNRITKPGSIGLLISGGSETGFYGNNRVLKSGSHGFGMFGANNTLVENSAKKCKPFGIYHGVVLSANFWFDNRFGSAGP